MQFLGSACGHAPEYCAEGDLSKLPNPKELDALKPVPYIVLRDKFYVEQTRPELGPVSTILAGAAVETALQCAQACTQIPGCSFATWHGADPSWRYNVTCWIKTWDANVRTCSEIAGALYRPASYLFLRKTPECVTPPLHLASCTTVQVRWLKCLATILVCSVTIYYYYYYYYHYYDKLGICIESCPRTCNMPQDT
jgi:hypothetical protein